MKNIYIPNGLIYFCTVEKIYIHIEKLLGHNEYVVVPGLGGFVLQQQSAAIIDNKLIAPRKTIAFNALMHHADGLLVIEIARTERISYRKAQELLKNEIALLKQELQTNGSLTFGNFGTFYFSNEGNISFIPNTIASFIPSNFRLNDLNLTDYSKKQHQLLPTNQKSFSTKNILRYAAVFALLLSMIFITEDRPTNPDAHSAAIVNLSKHTSATKLEAQTDSIIISDTTIQLIKQFEETQVTIKSKTFHVIVASMPTLQSAENYCSKMIELNYTTAKVLEPIKTYRVAIKSFTDKEEAIEYMEKLRTTDERFETAWVLCKK